MWLRIGSHHVPMRDRQTKIGVNTPGPRFQIGNSVMSPLETTIVVAETHEESIAAVFRPTLGREVLVRL